MQHKRNFILAVRNVEDKLVTVKIADTFSSASNPYGMSYTVVDNGTGTQTVTVNWLSVPAGASGIKIVATTNNGGTIIATYTAASVASPAVWPTLTTGDYTYLFYFTFPLGVPDELIILNELDGSFEELEPGGDPIRLIINNNQEDKLATIAGMQLVMQVNSQDNNTVNNILRGGVSDRRYYVVADIEGNIFFKGFLLMSELEEPFLPRPVFSMTATDGLGTLKNKKLLNDTGKNPTHENKIISYISWCLKQTGILENLNVVFNIREQGDGTIAAAPDKHFLNTQFLDAKTFETEPGESQDCYTVLNNICNKTGRLGQRHGEWWFKAFDEYDNQPDYVAVFDKDGNFVEMKPGTYYTKMIGINEAMFFSAESARVAFSSPAEFAALTFRYNNPKEIPCNTDIQRGDYIADISATEKKYKIDCWTLFEDRPNVLSTHDTAYIYRKFVNGYEIERYGIIDVASATIEQQLCSEFIPMLQKDKFDLNFSIKYNGQVSVTAGTITTNYAQVRLYADDGTYYTLEGGNSNTGTVPAWVACTSNFNTFQRFFKATYDGTDDDTQWRSVGFQNGDCPPLPKDGKIQIVICHQLKVNQFQLHFSPISFKYIPLINGSYQKFTGQVHTVSQSQNNSDKVEDEVYFSDAPVPILKGALLKYNGTKFVLSSQFWNAAVFPGGVPSSDYYHPYGWIQAQAVWNQVRLLNRIFRGSVQGIESGSTDGDGRTDLPTVFHTYRLTDMDEHTNSKKFMLLNYEMDLYKCEFRSIALKEAHDEVLGKKYDDTYSFKYLTS